MLPEGAAGEATLGVTLTVVEAAALGPLQPLAVTAIVAAPVKEVFQLTVPVVPVPLMVPALDGLIDQV